MNQDDQFQEPDAGPAAEARPRRRRTVSFLPIALLAAVALLAVAGGLSWRAKGRRVAELEQALAAATAERDAASAGAQQRQAVLDQAEAEREELDARRLELERELAAEREELARLRAEVASLEAQAAARQEPATARAGTAAPRVEARSEAPPTEPIPSPAAVAGTADPATGAAAAGPSAPLSTGAERTAGERGVEALEERLASAATDSPAGPEPAPAAAGQPSPATEEETVTVPEPAAGSAAEAQSLTVTFDVNSSYLPASLDGRLRRLAERLERGRRYEVELTASVGAGPVANAGDVGAAARYNRWLAERRLDRVAAFLRENAEADAGALAIERGFAADDSSRRVVVRVRPVP
jgi:outer membrane protein OmpA-like peptidoglycan-associated protein